VCSSDLVVIPYSGLDDGTLRVLRVRAESRNYWRRGGHLKSTKTEASAKLLPMHPSLKLALLEWRSLSLYNQPGDFVFPSERLKGKKPLDLASVLKKKIQPAFKRIGITGVGWHTFRHTVGTMLAEMGAPIDDPRLLASQRFARDQQVSPGNDKNQTPRAGEARGCHSAGGRAVGKQINLDPLAREVRFFSLLDGAKHRIGRWETLIGPKRTQIVFGGSL